MTELSNGAIEMHGWITDVGAIQDVNETLTWLQVKKHDYETPTGKVFVLFDSYDAMMASTKND